VVRPVDEDSRGIIDPAAGLTKFRLDRYPPSADVGRFVDRYWVVSWDLRDDEPFTQQVFAHPVVNIVFAEEGPLIHGVTTRIGERKLEGAGRALGIMFRPAGFRPFLGRALSTITDRAVPIAEVLGPEALDLARTVDAASDGAELTAAADGFLAARVPGARQPSETSTELVEHAAADPSLTRVDALAALAGVGVRQLQRRFADHVGVSPKAVIRRYRLYEAAERAARGDGVDWAALAAELGYADQAHLIRDFSSAIGTTPERYARANRRPSPG
jgi:AraC-like DNA-binding protein